MVSIVHCADLHLASAQSDAYTAFCNIITYTNRLQADLLLIAGDLYDSVFAPSPLIKAVQEQLARCSAKVFICGGNHDYLAAHAPLCKEGYPGNVTIAASGKMQSYPIKELSCTVHSCSFDAPHIKTSPLAGFHAPKDGRIHIGLLHTQVTSSDSVYAPISPKEIADSALHYLALGHKHTDETIQNCGNTVARYSGTPQPRRFDENGAIWYLVLDQNGILKQQRISAAVTLYQNVAVSVDGVSDNIQAAKRITDTLAEYDLSNSRFCVSLTGETQNAYRPETNEILRLIGGDYPELRLVDQSIPGCDQNDPSCRYSLQGNFLSRMEELLANAKTEQEKEQILLARRYGLQAFYGEVKIDAD